MATVWEEFGIAVKTARTAPNRKWTGEMLAYEAFGNEDRKTYISTIENGRTKLNALTVQKLAAVLSLSEIVTAPVLRAHLPEQNQMNTDANHLRAMAAADTAAPPTSEALMIALAYEFAQGSHIDLQTAYTGLRGALQAATDMKAQLARIGNVDAQLAAILQRVDELNDKGLTDEAAERLEAAIRSKEAELETLQDSALKQDRLRNRPDAAAQRLIARLYAAAPPGGVFNATRDLLREWLEEGERLGDPFGLHVARALALANRHDKGPRQAPSLADLALCQLALGERDADPKYLRAAAKNFAIVLDLCAKQKDRQNWAIAQNSLGTALRELGTREGDTARLHQAIAAYQAALTIRTANAAPMDWAATQNNLGTALAELGTREGDTARLHQAVAAFQAALTIHTPKAAPMDWAGTQNNLAIAYLALHDLDQGADWLD